MVVPVAGERTERAGDVAGAHGPVVGALLGLDVPEFRGQVGQCLLGRVEQVELDFQVRVRVRHGPAFPVCPLSLRRSAEPLARPLHLDHARGVKPVQAGAITLLSAGIGVAGGAGRV